MLSQVEENYLKAIYGIAMSTAGNTSQNVSTSSIARELDVNAASVTDMIQKRLAKKGLVNYVPYQGVQLTESGKRYALQIVRKHRLWEVFLVDKLKFGWSEVHDIAEQLEHIRSSKLVDKLDDFLGNPKFDPHGEPIPDKDGVLRLPDKLPLAQLRPQQSGTLVAVKDDTRELLEFLEQSGLVLGTIIQVLKVFPYDHSVLIQSNEGQHTLSRQVVENLYIRIDNR